MSLSLEAVERFWEQGYLHVPAVLPDDEARALRSACETQPTGDITAIPDFAMVMLDERVVEVVRDLLGGHVQYWGEWRAALTRTSVGTTTFTSTLDSTIWTTVDHIRYSVWDFTCRTTPLTAEA